MIVRSPRAPSHLRPETLYFRFSGFGFCVQINLHLQVRKPLKRK